VFGIDKRFPSNVTFKGKPTCRVEQCGACSGPVLDSGETVGSQAVVKSTILIVSNNWQKTVITFKIVVKHTHAEILKLTAKKMGVCSISL